MKTVSVLILLLLSNVLVGYSQDWKYDLNDAFKEANASGKDVLLFFSTSQDCLSCKTLEQKVLRSPEFLSYAESKYILVKEDFSLEQDKDIESKLLVVEKYNKDGFFPLVVIINRNTKVIGQLGAYNNESPQQFLAKLQSIKKS
jgi:thioredoxin-related protein